jgi:predicted RNA binding protein YcfA (HicA-like mRNA interferase family)
VARKIRELIRDLERAGFVNRGGKGGHRNFVHPQGGRVTISGKATIRDASGRVDSAVQEG